MQFSQAIRSGYEIVRLNRVAMRQVASDPSAFAPALLITALVGIAMWISPPHFTVHGIITLPLFSLVVLFVGAGVLHFMAHLFGGSGEFMALLRVLGVGRVLGWLRLIPIIGPIADLWSLVIAVVAVEELYGLDRMKAILTVAIPVGVVVILSFIALLFGAVVLGVFMAGF
jgi:hypothetical protein